LLGGRRSRNPSQEKFVGTNDLVQYALAINHPNDAGHAAVIGVGMCGEMAGEPMVSLVLLGLGLDELSTKSTIRS
jgi:phosphotransferase system enzyme I (PtsI)